MTWLPVLVTVAVFAVYLAIRHPYRRVPLHIDTGFYVSNHLIANRRLVLSRGWNATFAGGSKVVPELFYSLVYLLCGGERYPSVSRLCFSVYNFVTAIAVGLLAWTLAGGDVNYYYAGLIVFALLSSEPHWGGYHECGEQFEVLPQVLAVICLYVGVQGGHWWLCSLAALLWTAETCFIKLSAAAGFFVLFAAAAWLHPWTILPVLGGGLVGGVAYLLWLMRLGRTPGSLIATLWGHEVFYGRRFDLRALIHRLGEKTWRVADTVTRQPIVPLVALYGLFAGGPVASLIWWYLAAVAVSYLVQAADVRYYLIPFWPPLAILGATGAVALANTSMVGYVLLAALALAWLWRNVIGAYRADTETLNRWVWAGMFDPAKCDRNLALVRHSQDLRRLCHGKSLFVYGPYNQACLLAEASYPTPILSAASWMDDMAPGWQRQLCERLVESPPDCVLDTGRCFAAVAVRDYLGLDYELTHVFADHLRLYALRSRDVADARPDRCISFAPQTGDQLTAEEDRSSGLQSSPTGHTGDDRLAAAARTILNDLHQAGCHRVGVYGAGRTTVSLLDTLCDSPVDVVAVFDDDVRRQGQSLARWTIRPLSDATELGVEVIVVSSERFEGPMLRRCRPYAERGIMAIGLQRGGPVERQPHLLKA